MSAWAKLGAQCVCISRNPSWDHLPVVTPELGGTYTIREVRDDALLLAEIHNEPIWFIPGIGWGEPDFGVWRFRPLASVEDDVAHFQHQLNTVEEPA